MVIITDTDTLITDLQQLLTHPHATPTIAVSNGVLSLPRQLLSSRNTYFRKLLSQPWYRPNLTKPNTSTQVFQDLLEFLVTGCVTLSSHPSAIAHNLNLAFLANETLNTQLEDIVVTHISSHLSCNTINDYLNNLNPPLQSIDTVLKAFLKSNTNLIKSLPRSPQTVTKVCQLLSTTQLPPNVYPDLARYIKSSTTFTNLKQNPVLKDCILTIPAPTFVRYFEDFNIFTAAQLLQKYRHEAVSSTTVNPPVKRVKTRLLYESKHPHERCARVEQTVRHVTLLQGTHAKLVFHERSALGENAVLAFFTQDPGLGAQPCKLLVGSVDQSFVIPSHHFWFVFSCRDGVCAWGWRFFVEPCAPRVDYPGLTDG